MHDAPSARGQKLPFAEDRWRLVEQQDQSTERSSRAQACYRQHELQGSLRPNCMSLRCVRLRALADAIRQDHSHVWKVRKGSHCRDGNISWLTAKEGLIDDLVEKVSHAF